MSGWFTKKTTLEDLESKLDILTGRVDNIETRVDALEKQVEQGIRHFGAYDYRTKEELVLMGKQISDLLESVEALINHQENKEGLERAYALRRRLRNHRSRIERNLGSREG